MPRGLMAQGADRRCRLGRGPRKAQVAGRGVGGDMRSLRHLDAEGAMIETVGALVVFLFPLAYSPGRGNMFFAAIGARFGTRASFAASAGYHAATWGVTFAVGYGFAEVVIRYPAAFTAIKYAGSTYMLWLAVKFLRAGVTTGAVEAVAAGF